jgi:SAM-dependent methyltransferase
MTPKNYNDNFHEVHFQNSLNSAQEVVPLFLSYFKPENVLDVGCGLGTWMSVFNQNQCDVYGIDGDYVEINSLIVEKNKFKAYDLNNTFNLGKKFDLVISLEVAEHILPDNAKKFIGSLCGHSDVILFSAAIPGQEGTMHYNEQYNQYWVDIFLDNGYECIDFLRHKIWNNTKISWWYRQNILVFIKKSELDNPYYKMILEENRRFLNTYVHPELLEYKCRKISRLEERNAVLEKRLVNPYCFFKFYLKRVILKIKNKCIIKKSK